MGSYQHLTGPAVMGLTQLPLLLFGSYQRSTELLVIEAPTISLTPIC